MQTRWLLGRVAKELYKNKQEKEGVLLQALQEGEVRAFVLLLNNSHQIDIPVEVWKEITDVKFNVRRRYNGRWRSLKFKIPAKFAESAATKTIQKSLENLISGRRAEFESERDSDWLRDLNLVWSEDNAIKITLQRALVDRLVAIRHETEHDALVYMTKDEALKFVGAPSLRQKRGRRPIESDDFWIEVLRSVAKEKPKLTRERFGSILFRDLRKDQMREQ